MGTKALLALSILAANSLLLGCGGSGGGSSAGDTSDTSSSTASGLRINEIVAASDGGNDWIELYATEGSIDLSSYSLVDDNPDHTAQALPNITLSAGEFIVIQAIDETDTPPDSGYYVTFKLGGDDAVTLYKNNVQVDQLDWEDGDAPEGSSFGLYTDGSNNAQTLTPTPGEANALKETSDTALTDLILNHNAAIRVNEIVAADAAGGYDWLELFVTASENIYLGDYSLADENGVAFQLPNVTLAPGSHYRIYASTDASDDVESVGFKLGASDEVSLYLGEDLVDRLAWDKGEALLGFSYGRYPDGSDATQVLSPTPSASNAPAIHGPLVISEVVANASADGFDWFELYNNSDDDIELKNYSVLDSSADLEPITLPEVTLAPGEYYVIYATTEDISEAHVGFKLGNSDELSLLLNGETVDFIEWDSSDVMEGYSYGIDAKSDTWKDPKASWNKATLTPTMAAENENVSAFDTQSVRNLYINISEANWQDILANPLDEEYHETSITLGGITLDSVAIRTKGGSSLSSVARSTSDRYSFKIDINEYVSGQKFFGLKKFTLQNSFNDPSYMRETIAYNLLDTLGVPSPERAYVNVYINNELFGLYLMVEAVDGEFVEKHFANANGDLYKPDGVGSDLQWLGSNIASYSDINLQTNEDSSDQGAFIEFVAGLNDGSTEQIDVDNLLRYMAVSVALSNLDSYHGPLAHNYYIYEQDGDFTLLPWDFNEAFGTFSMGCSADIRGLYIDEPTDGALADKPLIANVFANPTYLENYHSYLWQLINGPLQTSNFQAQVASIADLIRPHVANDPTAFYSATQFETNLNSTVSRFYGLTSFMSYRVANMTQQLNGQLPAAGTGNGYCSTR